MRRILVFVVLLAGCKRCSTSALTTATADAGRPATMWVSTPDTTGELASIIEGPCLRLRASALGKEVYLHDFGVVARWSGTAPVDAGKLSRNLEGTRVGWLEGQFPDNAWLRYSVGSVGDHALRWDGDKWMPAWGDITRFHVTSDGAVAATFASHEGMPSRPDVGPKGDRVLDLGVRGDETFALVERSGALEARRVKKGVVTSAEALGALNVYVTAHGAYVAGPGMMLEWSGTSWRKVSSPPNVRSIEEDPGGIVWMLTDANRILRASVDVTPPAAVSQFAGAKVGAPWIIAGGELSRWDSGAWKKVALPKPSHWPTANMRPSYVVVKDASEAWVQAEYDVDPFGTGPQARSALLRQGPAPRSTLRCMPSERTDPIPGFIDWPPLADASCTTPFVILGASAVPTDWKAQIATIGMIDGLSEITIGSARYLGAPAKSFDDAKELQKKGSGASEVVCGVPPSPRPIR